MASQHKTFLVRSFSDKEAIMRLPIDRYGSITIKGMKAVQARFFDGKGPHNGLKYAICIEAFSNGHDLAKAIQDYYKDTI